MSLDQIVVFKMLRSNLLLPNLVQWLRSVVVAALDIIWITSLLREINNVLKTSPILCSDPMLYTTNSMCHAHGKHIKLDYHFV